MHPLDDQYKALFESSIAQIAAKRYQVDPLIDDPNDNRMGLTLRIRPSRLVAHQIWQQVAELQQKNPLHYFYPIEELHITVMTVVSCYPSYCFDHELLSAYCSVIERAISNIQRFTISLEGVTASPACVMVQGFPQDNTLEQIRENLRREFSQSALEQSLDRRYVNKLAHLTAVRFKNSELDVTTLLQWLLQNRNRSFGKFEVSTLELVLNDWYHRGTRTTILWQFDI